MLFLTLIVGIVLLLKADALKCYDCVKTCTNTTKECPVQGQQCADMRVLSYHGSSNISDVNVKTCALAEDCVEHSVNYGVARTVVTSKCCTSNLCNTQRAPDASKSNPNGKKCFRCEGQKCTTTLNCVGNEDFCISTTVKAVIMKGCATKTICSNAQIALMTGAVGEEASCCQGDYCNTDSGTSASSTSAGLLLLVAPLMSLVLFS
ncbi:urokinase plasminogen activator surface receptor-like [Parambassis ranga]|uniref:Urokinase plasminogen activator surface receptor-like n=1 Tax=Parambassis ranga TaxID=210632 RepID=A0A6P7JX57_9TELE|nr:urokinase plasminogen activator surface receptor-like [Parambassis ranga]XP_028281561.1 urokinase plasminogen activator surface receptor-like [Parambassis ranga]